MPPKEERVSALPAVLPFPQALAAFLGVEVLELPSSPARFSAAEEGQEPLSTPLEALSSPGPPVRVSGAAFSGARLSPLKGISALSLPGEAALFSVKEALSRA